MSHNKSKAIYPLLTAMLFIFCMSSCAEKTVELEAQETDIPVKIYKGLQLGNLLNEVVAIHHAIDLVPLLNKEWYSAVNVKLLNKEEMEFSINNCNEYFKYQDKGITPVKENEISAYAELVLTCQVSRDIANASSSKITFINNFSLNKSLPDKSPKKLAMVISKTESEKINANSALVVWSDVNKITEVELKDKFKTIYHHLGAVQEIELIAQGDFDTNGIEDIIISIRNSVDDGSYSALKMFCLTKTKPAGNYEIIKEYHF